jgi:hypothetical protein
VNCAEEAYAETVHREDFSRLQAELANTSAGLLAEQRRQADSLIRAFGLPTRNEVDALYAQVKDLRRELAERTQPPGSPPASGGAARGTTQARRGAKPAGAPRSGRHAARRARRPKR